MEGVMTTPVLWGVFGVAVVALLVLDLGVFHRKAHVVRLKESLAWSAVWVALALLFNLGIYFWRGPEPALEFLTGYVIEKVLSIDTIFVFLLIFSYFRVPAQYQHTVLFWGIVGALVMRLVLIAAGVALIQAFQHFEGRLAHAPRLAVSRAAANVPMAAGVNSRPQALTLRARGPSR